MAQTGYTPISLYYSTTAAAAPTAGNLVAGELALNTQDEKLYFKNAGGTIKLLASSAGAAGDVVGPASSTDNAIVRFDGTTGKLVQNSVVTIADSTGDISGVGQLNATTLDATNLEVTNIKAKDGTASATIADATGVMTIGSSVLTTTDINGGTIDATAIGGSTPAAGAFTTLSATVADAATAARMIGTTGRIRFHPYQDATIGALIDSSNTAENAYLPLSLRGSIVRIMDGPIGVFTSTGLTVQGTLNVTGVATFRAGTAAAPAITTSGDTNTGIYFPAADVTAITTAGSERMRIDSGGKVGIGLSSFSLPLSLAADGNGQNIQINGRTGDDFGQIFFRNFGGANNLARIASDNGAGLIFGTGSQTAPTVPTERMRIDSSGNLLVGTTSVPSAAGVSGSNSFVRSATDATWTLLAQNTAASGGARGIIVNYSGQSPNDTTNEAFFFYDSVGTRFGVRSNGGIENYQANDVNLSDRREKINFAPAKSYLDTICAIPVQTFNYIDQNIEDDPGLTLGVVAQDVQAVAPEMVVESNWAGQDEEPKMRLSIYQTDLQYALMKCIQELKAELDTAKARIAALEAQ